MNTNYYLRESNHSARRTSTGVASCQRVRMVAASEVVFAGMHDQATSDDAAVSSQRDDGVAELSLHNTGLVGLDVAQITDVTNLIGGSAVVKLKLF